MSICSVPANQPIYQALIDKTVSYPADKPDWYQRFLDSLKPPVYTAENPRRSRRIATKPQPKYFDENELMADAIEELCNKKGWAYSDEMIVEFNTWLSTADKYSTQRYNWHIGKYEPMDKPAIAKRWVQYYSKTVQQQKKQQRLNRSLINYCKKNGFDYRPLMGQKFAEWIADPANKNIITYTYNYNNGVKLDTYDRAPIYCINKWFSTLKKTVIF